MHKCKIWSKKLKATLGKHEKCIVNHNAVAKKGKYLSSLLKVLFYVFILLYLGLYVYYIY